MNNIEINNTEEIGVIVGRFQVASLHKGHLDLISQVAAKHRRIILFIGQSRRKSCCEDPLNYNMRFEMIRDHYPRLEIHRIDDVYNKTRWSKNLDSAISVLAGPMHKVVLYGSRDSFISAYNGKYPTREIPVTHDISATELRKSIGINTENSPAFRRGVIWATQNDWPKIYPTVDVIIFDNAKQSILLGKKPTEDLWRFPGGFADINSLSYEDDAVRETLEETNLVVTKTPEYLGSFMINDPRYAGKDRIRTSLFLITEWDKNHHECAGDDLELIKWVRFQDISPTMIMPIHHGLWKAFVSWLQNKMLRLKIA